MRNLLSHIPHPNHMFLSDREIRAAVEKGDIRIDEFEESRLGPVSYDVLLGNNFQVTDPHHSVSIDPAKKVFPTTKDYQVSDEETFVLHPGVTVLGTLRDFVGSEQYLIQISGKSSLARAGLIVHNTAGIINPGHFLHITLELANLNSIPIILRPGMEIAQLTFSVMTSTPEVAYNEKGRYVVDNWDNFAQKREKATPDNEVAP